MAKRTYQIQINGAIGGWGFNASYMRTQLAKYKGKHVNVRISSLGGSVQDALDIRQQLIDHGDADAYLFSGVASAATIIATGAKKVFMSKYSTYLVHKVSNVVRTWGVLNADQLAALIDKLKANKEDNETYDKVLATIYADRSGKSIDEILDILKKGAWIDATTAKEYGFVDEILEEGEKEDIAKTNEKLDAIGLPAIDTTFYEEKPHTANQEEQDAPINKFLHGVANFFSSLSSSNPAPTPTNQSQLIMNKDFTRINTLLNVEGVESKEDKVTLSTAQFQELENALQKAEDEKTALEADKTTLQEKLDKLPGGSTNSNEGASDDGTKSDEPENVTGMFNTVKDLM